MKLIKRSKELELNLNTEFGSVVLSTISNSMGKLWNHLSKFMLKNAGQDVSHPNLLSCPG